MVEFRHESWRSEGPWEMLKHYNIAAVLTDCPDEELQFLYEITITADHSLVRWHGRNSGTTTCIARKNFKIREETKIVRAYFNNQWVGKAVLNAFQFKEMNGQLSDTERSAMKHST